MSSSMVLSPYSNSSMLEQVVFKEVCEYLGFEEAVVNYQRVDTRHQRYVVSKGFPFTEAKMDAKALNEFFLTIKKFPKLISLALSGKNYPDLITPYGTGKIERLAFEKSSSRIPTAKIMQLMEAVNQVKGLRMSQLSIPNKPYFAPVVGESLTDAAKAKLSFATDLHLDRSGIHPQGIIEILQNSQNFTSVNLTCDQVNNGVFTELAAQPGLTSLTLYYTFGEADYAILAGCRNLESFTPSKQITEEALISIIQANPNLKHLNLEQCEAGIVTDRVLQAIAENCKGLESINLYRCTVTDAGIRPLLQNCLSLVSIEDSSGTISSEVILELKNLKDFKEIKFIGVKLSDEFLNALFQLPQLTALSLNGCGGFTPKALEGIKALTNLEFLNLDGILVLNDDVVIGVVDECKKLNTLRINAYGSALTVATIEAIRIALAENRTQLANLSCEESALDINYATREGLSDEFLRVNMNHDTKWR